MPKINSLEVVHQDTNQDPYQNLHDILVALNASLAVDKEVVDGDARASIENLLEMYANDKEAFLRSLRTLTAQFKTSQAQYSEEILLLASQLEAQARRTTTLTAQTSSQYASVKEYSEVVASEVARKVTTYRQDSAPTGNLVYGDLWFDTNDNNKLYRWNGIVWVVTTDNSSLESFISTEYADDIAAISAQVDSKAETWFQENDPSTAWTTQTIRDMHDKDMWYKSSTKTLKIYVSSSNTWTTIEDQTAINAATAASNAQDTADGKIVTFVQASPPTAEGIGDLWMETDNNNKMFRWNGSSWVAVDDTRIAQTYARWGVQVDANGHIAGIQLNADNTGTSEFTVLANAFRVYNPSISNSEVIFQVKDGVVSPKNIRVDDGSGNWVFRASSSVLDMWYPIMYTPLAGNSNNPTLPGLRAVASAGVEAINGTAGTLSSSSSTSHGVRGSNKYNGASGLVGVANGYDFYAEGSGTNYGPFTGAHDALIDKDATYELGDIVVDYLPIVKKNISNTLFEVKLSTNINEKGVIGVVAKDNGLLSSVYPPASFGFTDIQVDEDNNMILPANPDYDPVKDTCNYITMNALGEGQVNVCGENGNISKGDLIVTSSIPGKGMKQADDIIRSYTVAKAREDVTFDSPTDVKQVACIYLCG